MKTKTALLWWFMILNLALLPSTTALYAQEQAAPLFIPSISTNSAENSTELPALGNQAAPPGASLEIALNFIEENRAAWGLTENDVAEMVVKDHYTTRHNGITHTYVRQRWQGIEVFNGDIQVNVAADGSILNFHNNFVADLAGKANTLVPSLSAVDAVAAAAHHLELPTTMPLDVVVAMGGPEQEVMLSAGEISRSDIPVSLVFVEGDGVRLAWNVAIKPLDGKSWPQLRIDAASGEILSESDWMQGDAEECSG